MSAPILHRCSSPNGQIVLMTFYCPGCKCAHGYYVANPGGLEWQWNSSMDKPTFTPSLLMNKDEPARRCHLWITDGKIQFCSDSYHELAGQTVGMVPAYQEP